MKRFPFVLVAATLLSLVASLAGASPTADTARLRSIYPRTQKYRVAHRGIAQQSGAARIIVTAPARVTRRIVTDFANYADFVPKFEQARVVGRKGKQTDVYLRVPILKGLAKIWAVMRFDPPREVGNGDYVMTAKMVKGNVKRFEATYRIKAIDARTSQLHLEMLLVPSFPAPRSIVADQVAGACDNAVKHFGLAAEHRFSGG